MTNMKFGSEGENVKLLQSMLGCNETGMFDSSTEIAVSDFQSRNKLVMDGVVGKKTWSVLTGLKFTTRWINEIVVHCTATEETEDFKAKDINRWHRQRGYQKIGYNYVIDLDGTIEEGRPLGEIGAHTIGHNNNSIGIVYVGGYRNGKATDTRTEAQKASMKLLIRQLMVLHGLSLKEVHVHNEYAKKACPCFTIAQLRKELCE